MTVDGDTPTGPPHPEGDTLTGPPPPAGEPGPTTPLKGEPDRRQLRRITLLTLGLTLALMQFVIAPPALLRWRFDQWTPVLGLMAAAVVVASFVVERVNRRPARRLTAVLVGLALSSVLLQFSWNSPDILRGNGQMHRIFHYYIGAKYFPELGYTDMYAATLHADDEWQAKKEAAAPEKRKKMDRVKDWSFVQRTRDMRTYHPISRAQAVEHWDRSRFSDARWAEFKRDLADMRPQAGVRHWKNNFMDLGFNPSPVWMVMGRPMAEVLPARGAGMWLLRNSDLPLVLLTFAAMVWGFGARAASVGILWLCAIDFNDNHLLGAMVQHDWLFTTVAGIALYRRGWSRAAGAVMAWGIMTRAFPAFLALPIAVRCVWDVIRARSLAPLRGQRWQFALSLGLMSALLFGASLTNGRGLQAWPEWKEKIGTHADTHAATSSQRIGVAKMALHTPRPGRFWAHPKGSPERQMGAVQGRRQALQAAGWLLLVPALWRRRDVDAMLLMMFGVFLYLTLSRYYASPWMLLPAMGVGVGFAPMAVPTLVACVGLLTMLAAYQVPGEEGGAYLLTNYWAFTMFGVLCLTWLGHDVREWWRGRVRFGPVQE